MAKLNQQIQTYIVQQFAMFATPQEIVDLVKENFNVETSRPQVFFYNADMNPKLNKKWVEIFKATRKKFLDETSSIAIANKSFRLKELDAMYRTQKNSKLQNSKAMRETLEQAAKESGDSYTNRKEITGANGGAIQLHSKSLDDWKKDATARTDQAAKVMELFEN